MPALLRIPRDEMPAVYIGEEIFDLPEPDWLLRDFIQAGGLTIIYGPPGGGKSLVMMDWANVLAAPDSRTEWRWMGRKRSGSSRVLYVMGEGQGGLSGRMQAWKQHRNVEKLPGVEWILEPVSMWRPSDRETFTPVQAALVEYVRQGKHRVVFFDTLAATFGGGNENSQQDMNQYLGMCREIQKLGCAVVIAHHSNKGSGDMRGSTVLKGAADTVIKMKPSFDDDTHALLTTRLYANKQKDGIPFPSVELMPRTYDVETAVGQSLVLGWSESTASKIEDRIRAFLKDNKNSTMVEVRKDVKGSNAGISEALAGMVDSGAATNDEGRYTLVSVDEI